MDPETPFRITLGAMLAVGFSMAAYYRIRADRLGGKVSRSAEHPLIRWALNGVGLGMAATVFAYLIDPRWTSWAAVSVPSAARWTGIAVGAAATVLVRWVLSHLGHNLTRTVVTRPNAALVTSGPYRYVRHPLYSIAFVGWLGLGMATANAVLLVGAPLAFVLLAVRSRQEEENLAAKFGDAYQAYRARTGRFWPAWRR